MYTVKAGSRTQVANPSQLGQGSSDGVSPPPFLAKPNNVPNGSD